MTVIGKHQERPRNRSVGDLAGWLIAVVAAIVLAPGAAQALPSFARQTGQPCASCHTGFPELTPYGRLFKLKGYTDTGGGSNVPPVAVMVQPSFTHTQEPEPGTAHFGPNDNFAVDQTSLFYGGAIDSALGVGAFAQMTYDGVARHLSWDNADIRWAHPTTLSNGDDFIYGITLNNNPSVSDVWNTTPAWRFPFAQSGWAAAPAASTLIEGGLAQKVLGLGGYAYWNDLVYAEFDAYRTLSTRTLTTLGTDSTSRSSIDGVAPYWRLALEPSWGPNSWEFGTFGMSASEYPQLNVSAGTDQQTDLGLDTEYQYNGERSEVGVEASYIHEWDDWSASQPLGLATNTHDTLDSYNIKTSYFYNHTYGVNLSYFQTNGSTDAALYGTNSANDSPNSAGFVAELDYIPFSNGGPNFWPWLNMRLALQYVAYTKFNGGTTNYDGNGHNASDNNTLYLLAWLMF